MNNPVDGIRRAIEQRQEQLEEPEAYRELMFFRLDQHFFALDLSHIVEVLALNRIFPVPAAPLHFIGVVNVRGTVQSAFNLASFLGLPGSHLSQEKGLLVRFGEFETVIIVDDVVDLAKIRESAIKPPPDAVNSRLTPYLRGELIHEKQTIMILNLAEMVSELTDAQGD